MRRNVSYSFFVCICRSVTYYIHNTDMQNSLYCTIQWNMVNVNYQKFHSKQVFAVYCGPQQGISIVTGFFQVLLYNGRPRNEVVCNKEGG